MLEIAFRTSISVLILTLFLSHLALASEDELRQQIQELKNKIEAPTNSSFGGYGEINFNHYNDSSQDQMDLRRFVMFLGHRFDENLTFTGEMEWEHAVSSSSDRGEAEIEQAYINYQLSSKVSMKAGLFLMPFGFLNASHEPPVFYGVVRNEVETRIIPSTWREGGLGLSGETDFDFDWNAGVVTGFNITKFDDSSSPLASVHQELQLAKARDLALYFGLNYRIPGWTAGFAVFSGKSTQGDADYKADNTKPSFAGINGRVTLGEAHVRWQEFGWDLEALYAKGLIGDADQINSALQTYNSANPTKTRTYVPEQFYGWLLQAAYKFSIGVKNQLAPFVRFEKYNTQEKMPGGFDADPTNQDQVTTAGLSFYPHQEVVFKIDYQSFKLTTGNNRFNLGIGYMF